MKPVIAIILAFNLAACGNGLLFNSGDRGDLGPNDGAEASDGADNGGDDAARAPVIVE